MTDFLTRVAQRAIGMAPAIQPVVVSRYAPARLPQAEVPDVEADPGLTAESSAANVEARSNAFSTLEIGKSRQRAFTKGNVEVPSSTEGANQLASEPEPTLAVQSELTLPTQTEPIHSTSFRGEVQHSPSLAVFDQEELQVNREIAVGPAFEAPQPVGGEAKSIVSGAAFMISSDSQPVLDEKPRADSFVSDERSVFERDSEIVARVEPPQGVLSGRRGERAAPPVNLLDRRTASPLVRQSTRNQESTIQEEPGTNVDEVGILVAENEPPLSTERTRNRRVAKSRESTVESFTETPASPRFPVLPDDRVEGSSPVIRVTIGRVEVRAVTQPPPTVEPPPSPTPKLSLDEFLRQHNGRRQ